jgi:tRNA dimethylallyltransferase
MCVPSSEVVRLTSMIAVLAGATATGKSSAALRFAREQREKGHVVEIINADAMQVYAGMDIGTAKASVAERVEVPHHLLDVVTPEVAFSVADYVARAETCISDVLARGNIPLIVGGTGFYVRALRQGLPTVPAADMRVQAPLWEQFEREGIAVLEQRLTAFSPEDATRAQKNPRRVIRALEIIERTGTAPKDFPMTRPKFSYALLALLPPVDVLQTRITQRVDAMFAAGLVDEVRGLLEHYPNQPTALQAIGYKEVGQFLRAELSEAACFEQVTRATLQYAKRQLTWFRKEVRQVGDNTELASVSSLARAAVSETLADIEVQRWLEHWAKLVSH